MGLIATSLAVLIFIAVINSYEAKTVCYTLAGSSSPTCFSNDPPFDNAASFLPNTPAKVGTKFYLYTRGTSKEQIYTDNLASSANLQKRDTKIIIHGYMGSGNDKWILDMALALLGVGDFNVISVDWSGGAKIPLNYYKSVANTRLVGAQIGLLIKALEDTYTIPRSSVHIIGHSLGAQTAGYAGKSLSGVGWITGLDPAGPAFYKDEPQVRLTKNDAAYVDILHTNGGYSLMQGMGIFEAVGTVDFYPNGGKQQPGCGSRTAGPMTTMLPDVTGVPGAPAPAPTSGSGCHHLRAIDLYTETIKGICRFRAYPCDPGSVCDTCGDKGCPRMGYYSLQDGANGSYYLTTTGAAPFC